MSLFANTDTFMTKTCTRSEVTARCLIIMTPSILGLFNVDLNPLAQSATVWTHLFTTFSFSVHYNNSNQPHVLRPGSPDPRHLRCARRL